MSDVATRIFNYPPCFCTSFVSQCVIYMSFEQSKITYLPYYGGAKGQSLKIIELSNGTIVMEIIKTVPEMEITTEIQPSELEMPQLPQRPLSEFANNLRNIHKTALKIIKIQEAAKRKGNFNDEEEAEYRENLESLHLSAEKLSEIHNPEEEDEYNFNENTDLGQWLARKKNSKKDKDKKKEEEKKKKEEEKRKEEEEEKRKEEEEEKRKQEKEKEKEEEEEGEGGNKDEEVVVVNLPPDDSSVAEAKPVGLAVAGRGGVAASKPIATAIVGPGGLAVAQPVGTAIAGVSPDQALVPIYVESENVSSGSKKDPSKQEKKKISNTEYLNKIIQRYHKV